MQFQWRPFVGSPEAMLVGRPGRYWAKGLAMVDMYVCTYEYCF